ncbi:hypothetical protein LT493_08435 [Streptomyces tricolor]|nr:hypothetical protein [Streptomyces tricolor]
MVGDAPTDLASARDAGIASAAALWVGPDEEELLAAGPGRGAAPPQRPARAVPGRTGPLSVPAAPDRQPGAAAAPGRLGTSTSAAPRSPSARRPATAGSRSSFTWGPAPGRRPRPGRPRRTPEGVPRRGGRAGPSAWPCPATVGPDERITAWPCRPA